MIKNCKNPHFQIEAEMTPTVEKIECDLERARREWDVWKNIRGCQSNYAVASIMTLSALEKTRSEAISNQTSKRCQQNTRFPLMLPWFV
jgi:hypothetical protein